MRIELDEAKIRAEGDLDFRGTLGVAGVPVGFTTIRLMFDLKTAAPQERVSRLLELTEKYCVIYQTLKAQVEVSVIHHVLK